MAEIRKMYGMTYSSLELEHDTRLPMSSVLRKMADYLEENETKGLLSGIYTQSHPDDDEKFLTHLIWADY